MSLVSAIITTKNRKNLLEKAIQSVLTQTYTEIECIVVVDGSDDGTCEYLESITDSRLRMIYIAKEESQGGNYARNKGIQSAKGEFLALLDDDDEWFPTKIEQQIKLFDNENVGLVYCGHVNDYDEKKFVRVYPEEYQQGNLSQIVFKSMFCTTSMMMIRKSVMEEIGGFDESIAFWQDYDVIIRICQVAEVAFVREPLMLLRHTLTDKHRLSNKVDGWMQAVRDQNRKYKNLIQKLPDDYKRDRMKMIYTDAAIRCEIARDRRRQRYYLLKIAKMTEKSEDYKRWLFNIGFNQTLFKAYRKFKVLSLFVNVEDPYFLDASGMKILMKKRTIED